MRPNFISDPHMHRNKSGRLKTNRIHNEIDEPLPNKPSNKCSYCRDEDHNIANCPYQQ